MFSELTLISAEGCRQFGFAKAAKVIDAGRSLELAMSACFVNTGRPDAWSEQRVMCSTLEALHRYQMGKPPTSSFLADAALWVSFFQGENRLLATEPFRESVPLPGGWDRRPHLAEMRSTYKAWDQATPEVQRIAKGLLWENNGAGWALEAATHLAAPGVL